MSDLLFVGADAALLEGLSQSIAALGCTPVVVSTLQDAREQALLDPPLVLVADRALVVGSGADLLAIPLAAGGAIVLYATQHAAAPMLPSALQRAVLAELVLPLERHRLTALVQHVESRARATGRTRRPITSRPPEPRPRI